MTRPARSLYEKIAQELGVEYLPMKEIGKLEGEELSEAYENYDKIMKISQDRKSDINAAHPPVDVKDLSITLIIWLTSSELTTLG